MSEYTVLQSQINHLQGEITALRGQMDERAGVADVMALQAQNLAKVSITDFQALQAQVSAKASQSSVNALQNLINSLPVRAFTTRQYVTNNFTASGGQLVALDTSTNSLTLTLPAAATTQAPIAVKWVAGTAAPSIAVQAGDAFDVVGGQTTETLPALGTSYILTPDAVQKVWTIISGGAGNGSGTTLIDNGDGTWTTLSGPVTSISFDPIISNEITTSGTQTHTAVQNAIAVETSRATAAENANATNIATNATAISNEITRAQGAETANASSISAMRGLTDSTFNTNLNGVYGPAGTAGNLGAARAQTLYGYASLASTVGPLGLPHWKQKLALSLLGQSPARILCLGDSTTAGISADSYTTATGTAWQDTANSYPRQLVSRLNALGIPAVMGMTLPGSAGGVDQHWSFTGGSLFTSAGVGIGGAQGVIMSHVSDTWTVTPGIAADTYKIYYWTVSGGGTFTATATGGSATTINTNAGTQQVLTATCTASAVSASNSVLLNCTVAGSGCVVFAVEFWDSTNPNKIRVFPAGCPGQDSGAFATGSATLSYGSRAVTKAIAPDLTIGSLGINDVYHGLSLATTQSNFTALATDAQLSGDMLWLSAIPPSTGNAYGISVSSINAWLLGLGGAYVDLQTRYGTNFFSTGLQTTDKIHPNALGYRDIAMCVADALVR